MLEGRTEEEVNDVNAPSLAEERGIAVSETSTSQARDFSDLVRVTVVSGGERTRVVGTTLSQLNRPHLLEAWGARFNVQLEPHLAIFRYQDRPGMMGRVGTALGEAGVNIVSAAVGRHPDDERANGEATMLVTADAPVEQDRDRPHRRDRRLRRRPRRQPRELGRSAERSLTGAPCGWR